ncbi:MAG: tetratricopeptide repeat protein [Isosphaeraceae bacterium]|nr:tetratricopeptide repeat protein [Isosphaeraceae bacterium]
MDGERCRQPACAGIVEAGFCNLCGVEPPGAVLTVAATTPQISRTAPGSRLSDLIGSTRSRRGNGTTRSSSRKHLGLGMVAVPELPAIDPERAVMADPVVPEYKRFCANPGCHDAEGNPTPLRRRTSGHCPQCGQRYSFEPTLHPGDVVAGQYEVRGCIAYGGLGWIYLAKDSVLNRWVVLKGLLNTADESAAAAAVAERQFLAAVKHANIVGIYNFVKKGPEGFIVMEYVGGITLKEIRKERGPLPPGEAIAYMHRVLAAFSYLHRQGMVYCDFKLENVMVEGDPPDVKLIDMGAVRLIDDRGGDIYGTKGYSAPEAGDGPTVASDLFTVGRTLAVLLMDFRFQGTYEFTLPPPAEQPILARHESLYRLLRKATAREPDRRFQSADEMADQLAGVLREVAAGTGTPKPIESALFGGDLLALRADEGVGVTAADSGVLPELKVHPEDPAANYLLATAAAAPRRQVAMLREALPRFPRSAELLLRLARALMATHEFDEAEKHLAAVEATDPFDWRVTWYRGVSHLLQGRPEEGQNAFDWLYGELPGELAVKLAVAVAAEMARDTGTALRLYELVARTDPAWSAAAFGLARCLASAGRRAEAVEAYQLVPAASSLYGQAQAELARVLIRTSPAVPSPAELTHASQVVEGLAAEGAEHVRLQTEVLATALSLLDSKALAADPSVRLLGQPLDETAVRRGLETAFRQLARLEDDRARQIEFVDSANAVRPRTWV